MTKKIFEFAIRWQAEIERTKCLADLQIWLYEPFFNDSQIVATKIDSKGEQRNIFFSKPQDFLQFPYDYFGISKDLAIDWVHYRDSHFVFDDVDNPTKEEIDGLLNDGYVFEEKNTNADGRIMKFYENDIGNVWVGRFVN